ncbi:MAG: bifunctional demethylmenaquinone methyltransferase/2-methoxy-6-polyprenyl-1,4-benzoquinol methylase UbiE [SAR324 cluster bacterium]|nr:bifunctional demethylmenaquinone methyltransferase/2-methoxy-6-polyprenyl-1,4-benzoquinol methylase UbiE [SAR324 cluster bacterium]
MAFEIPQDEEKYQYVQSRFSAIAAKYDLFNDLITQGMHRYWKNCVRDAAELTQGDQALDICCGTGDITMRLREKTGDTGLTVGLDFSHGMLDTAQTRGLQEGCLLVQGDATKLPFANESFDAVTVGYGLRNLVDINAGLNEVYRILKPGGRFISLDMGKVKNPLIKGIFDFYFFQIVPRIGKALYPNESMFDYFPQSAVEYPSQEKLKEMLEVVGFAKVDFTNFHFGGVVMHVARK